MSLLRPEQRLSTIAESNCESDLMLLSFHSLPRILRSYRISARDASREGAQHEYRSSGGYSDSSRVNMRGAQDGFLPASRIGFRL